MSINQVFQAQAVFQAALLAKPNVVGVAIGNKNESGEPSVVVLVSQKKPLAGLTAQEVIPSEVGGVKTDVVEIGYPRAYDSPTGRFRPTVPCGVSIGQYQITAGTLGAIVTDVTTGEKFILSNNHVLANSNLGLKGDPILQPGPIDGGQNPGDMVARLERFIQIRYTDDPDVPPPVTPPPGNGGGTPTPTPTPGCDVLSGVVAVINGVASILGSSKRVAPTSVGAVGQQSVNAVAQTPVNEVDCALARPVDPNMFTGEILGIGQVTGTKPAALNMKVRKSGRTTGYTEGTITLLNATVNVAYGNRTAQYSGQIITSPMSQGGDSGSLIVDGTENKAVGLLFAGSNLSTIFNPIDRVFAALGVTI